MKVFVIYCHPSKTSFTYAAKEEFLKGLRNAEHEYVVSDLYEMNFNGVLSEEEYLRETYYKVNQKVEVDVLEEQSKLESSNAVVFIYPVFWTEAPAKLVGWFDRVWTTGYAYNPNPSMKILKKALFIACAGKTKQSLMETGELEAMRIVMLGDRIKNRAEEKDLIVFDGVTHWDESSREKNVEMHLKQAYILGKQF